MFEYILKQLSPAEKLVTYYFRFVLILQEVSQVWETEKKIFLQAKILKWVFKIMSYDVE